MDDHLKGTTAKIAKRKMCHQDSEIVEWRGLTCSKIQQRGQKRRKQNEVKRMDRDSKILGTNTPAASYLISYIELHTRAGNKGVEKGIDQSSTNQGRAI